MLTLIHSRGLTFIEGRLYLSVNDRLDDFFLFLFLSKLITIQHNIYKANMINTLFELIPHLHVDSCIIKYLVWWEGRGREGRPEGSGVRGLNVLPCDASRSSIAALA